jgi:hypothetical protein
MALALTACRIASVRRALRAASSAAERLPALGALVEVACELRDDDLGGAGAARARRLLDEAIGYLRAASMMLPAGDREQRVALYLLARACLRRDDGAGLVPDPDDAIVCLRRLLPAWPAEEPDRSEVEALLADALLARAFSADGDAADVDEAMQLIISVFAGLPPEHPGHRGVRAALALAFAGRYLGFGGAGTDRDAAEAYAAETLAGPGQPAGPDEPAARAHLVLAWMALARQYTPKQRSIMLEQAEIEAAKFGPEAAAGLLAAYGVPQISAADAETAIGHLRQIPPDVGGNFSRTSVPLLWGLAQLALMRTGSEVTDVGQVAESLGSLAAQPETVDVERGELLAFRAALLAGQSGPGAAGALGDAVSGLPPGHLMRSPALNTLRSLLGRQVDQAESAADLGARLDEVAAVLDRLPHDDPEAARAMTLLAMHILNASISNRSILQQDRLFAQFERLASGLAADDPLVPVAEFMVWSARHIRARLEFSTERADAALGEMIRRADLVPPGHPVRPFALSSVAIAYLERHAIGGEQRNLELADRAINKAIAEAAPGGPFAEGTAPHGQLVHLRGHVRMRRAVYQPSLPTVNEAIADLEQAEAELGPAESSRIGLITSLGAARFLREQLTSPIGPDMTLGPVASDEFDRQLAEAERVGPASLEYPVLAAQAAAGLMMRGLGTGDVTQVDRAIALLAGVCAIPTLGLHERPRMLEFHGEALHCRYSMTRDPRDLGNAIGRLEEARRAVDQEPGSPRRASVLQALASAYRSRGNQARGDVGRAVEIGLEGLRERAANVLLQDSDDNALDVARQATNDAGEMARWFLVQGRGDAAVSAIELGRGMVLHAATSGTGVADALTEAGYPGLAVEWTAQAARPGQPATTGDDEPPQDDDLRYRAMLALEGTAAQTRLLSPPTTGEVAAALASSRADALVYLLPHDDDGYGIAVLVDQAGIVSSLPLMRLRASTSIAELLRTRRAVEQAAAALAAVSVTARAARRAAQAAFDSARAEWQVALDAACDWAWRSAIGQLLPALAKRADGTPTPGAGDPRRIVLVPGGELGLIPWHAARRPIGDGPAGDGPAGDGGTRYDYACRHVVISYAASARQFIDAARRPVRPWPHAPVLISNPGPSLACTRAQVAHAHAAHYANGAVFGSARYLLPDPEVPGAAAAGPGDVLAALPHGTHPGASLLHFGYHGRVSRRVLGSSLLLGTDAPAEAPGSQAPGSQARGTEISLSVSDILRQARARERHANGGGLVVLASCLTDVTEADYDEALSLATAFLAAGSVGVVAARWTVRDAATALFMAAFHRFLNEGYADPARALREAQLWMLDPDREVPESWPQVLRDEAGLDGQPAGPDLTSTGAWAGFTYQGR